METVIIALLVVLIALVVFVMVRKQASGTQPDQSQLMIQQQLDSLRNEVAQTLKNTTDVMFESLRASSDTISNQLGTVRQSLQQTTEQFNQQLSAQTNSIGNRLDNAAKVIQDLQKSQGQLMQAGEEIKHLGQSMQKLEELLKAPKLRGGLGESLLEDLLKQVLPAANYAMQYQFRSGSTVDAVIKTANGIIPIDSKFPLENFRKMAEAQSDSEKKAAYKTFVTDVKKHIEAISQKYILPDEGTFDFALMYIPAENIYYETVIKNEMFGDANSIYDYCVGKRVFAVSPNTFYPTLQVIALGFKGMEVEKSAKTIIQSLARLQGELSKFVDDFETVGKHLNNAKNKYDDATRKLDAFDAKLKQSSGNIANGAGEQQVLIE